MRVQGTLATKPATMVDDAAAVLVEEDADDPGYASRGAWKLAGALERLGGPEVEGRNCLDAGASTGGFTDVLLRRGARRVTCVDVGYGLLDWRLQTDERVTVIDRTNVRLLQPGDLPYAPELIVADGDRVVVLARGHAQTVEGRTYANDYCFVFRMQDGKIVEVREYMDTILADAALGRA